MRDGKKANHMLVIIQPKQCLIKEKNTIFLTWNFHFSYTQIKPNNLVFGCYVADCGLLCHNSSPTSWRLLPHDNSNNMYQAITILKLLLLIDFSPFWLSSMLLRLWVWQSCLWLWIILRWWHCWYTILSLIEWTLDMNSQVQWLLSQRA